MRNLGATRWCTVTLLRRGERDHGPSAKNRWMAEIVPSGGGFDRRGDSTVDVMGSITV